MAWTSLVRLWAIVDPLIGTASDCNVSPSLLAISKSSQKHHTKLSSDMMCKQATCSFTQDTVRVLVLNTFYSSTIDGLEYLDTPKSAPTLTLRTVRRALSASLHDITLYF
jgi:hypothetical protein